MHIILASASPRRRELIHQIGWTEEVCPSSFSEAATPKEPAEARRISRECLEIFPLKMPDL